MMGHLGWTEQDVRRADLCAIHVAWRGYLDKQDDVQRMTFIAAGAKDYPEKRSRKPKKPISFSQRWKAHKTRATVTD